MVLMNLVFILLSARLLQKRESLCRPVFIVVTQNTGMTGEKDQNAF